MEGPGLSLFQGSESIQLNANAQRLEEDEEQEYFKQRDKEIDNMLTNAFDDLDDDTSDDDASTINRSNYQNKSNIHINSNMDLSQLALSDNNQRIVPIENTFDEHDHIDNRIQRNQNEPRNCDVMTEMVTTVSGLQREFDIYGQAETPFGKGIKMTNNESSITETPYELARMPSTGFCHPLKEVPEETYTFRENYDYNCETPANHYENRVKRYPSNGYIDGYEKNVQLKLNHEYGGGDNISSEHFNHSYKTAASNGITNSDSRAYKTAEYNSQEQLEVLYSVKLREIERLAGELKELRSEKEEEKNQLNRKLALTQAEAERSNISRNQAQHALVDAKAEIVDLRSQIETIKEQNQVLEKSNKNMKEELNIARDSVTDLQQKIAVLERVQTLQANDRTHEKFLKQAQEKHAIEMKNMQTQIDILTAKLNAKETSFVSLENKLADVRRSYESLMVEKADTMNKLTQALKVSQEQCNNLMATNNRQQIMELQVQVKILSQEKEDLQKTVLDLQKKLELAKSEIPQYDSLIGTSLEDESDSMRQLKLGESYNKSRSRISEDISNKLRGELQRCLAAQASKRKEISRLENTLSQKQKELDEALAVIESCQQEKTKYAKRVNELEQELESLLTDEALKANAQIQKLSDHLNDINKKYDNLKEENASLRNKLDETLALNQNLLLRQQRNTSQQEQKSPEEFNKEFLEIHDKAVERIKQEAQVEIVQLTVQLEQTQKELDRVKELYINVCSSKDELINNHKEEMETIKNRYATFEERCQQINKLENDLQGQIKYIEKLKKECNTHKCKIIELEKDLSIERKRKEEYTIKIHDEIEKAKEEALKELRNAHPNQQISFLLPDHCSEHSNKIQQLEEDCKRLEEKLCIAVEEHKKISQYQSELDDSKLKMAQLEISQESWKKKYESAMSERHELLSKINKLEAELVNIKKLIKLQNSDDSRLKIAQIQLEKDSLAERYSKLLSERNVQAEKISKLEVELPAMHNIIADLESKLRWSGEQTIKTKCEMEKDISRYMGFISQLSSRLYSEGDGRKNDVLEQRIKKLENELQEKEQQLQRLNDVERIREERDKLVLKLKNQAKQFELYVKSQKQVSAELNLSPRSFNGITDLQKIRETIVKEVRDEMKQKITDALKNVEKRNQLERKELQEKYRKTLLELQEQCKEKSSDLENLKKTYQQDLNTKKAEIERLQNMLKQKQLDAEEEKSAMAEFIQNWATEMKQIKSKETELNNEIKRLRECEKSLEVNIQKFKEKETEMSNNIDTLKHKYENAKKSAINYKELAKKKEQFLKHECERLQEGYKKAMNQVEQKLDKIVNVKEKQIAIKLKEIESRYAEEQKQFQLDQLKT